MSLEFIACLMFALTAIVNALYQVYLLGKMHGIEEARRIMDKYNDGEG